MLLSSCFQYRPVSQSSSRRSVKASLHHHSGQKQTEIGPVISPMSHLAAINWPGKEQSRPDGRAHQTSVPLSSAVAISIPNHLSFQYPSHTAKDATPGESC